MKWTVTFGPARAALAAGAVIGASAAFLAQQAAGPAPVFAPSQELPSAIGVAPPPRHVAATGRARALAREAIQAQNLPGVSVAVGDGEAVIWAEGFGWRDVVTRSPVTTETRFNIGTAASAVAPAAAPLGLPNTGADTAAVWSPEAIGEPGEDFPPFTLIRHLILQPMGLAPAEYPLPGGRATFYVPTADDNPLRGRRLMALRDLACCANGVSFYSTPSDLVRVALTTNPGTVDGELAGGTVMSLTTGPGGIAVAVTSNVAHANTAALARRIAVAFEQTP